ncbi:hypothetical protein SteCoe_20730 [Stentor coeruleus]|uniref:RING-type domain-containing protein n=1 Tax=Stentor coeruleus TaxID=5963 RepID=A0A1R2BRE5_9CILI|nr:hypothetical protein SteCoe_20730 [Stentor coeruleus]
MFSCNEEYLRNPLEKKSNENKSDEVPDTNESKRLIIAQSINSRNENKKNKLLSQMQVSMTTLREKSLISLNKTIDRTQNCIFCQFPIDKNDISFSLICNHRSCFVCIYNKLQDIINEEPQLLLCNCNAVIYIYLLSKDIEIEFLNLYVEMISKILKINYPIKNYCPYDLEISEESILKFNKICEKCKYHYCQKCGLDHLNKSCLEYFNDTFKEEIIKSYPKCTECNENNQEINLSCECKLCNNCCKSMIKNFLYLENPINDPVCKKHKIIIPKTFIYQVFGDKTFFIKEQEKAIDYLILSPKFICEICLGEFNVNQSITLDCDHRFCSLCIKTYLNICMNNYSFAIKIGCPKCGFKISYEILKCNSGLDDFERYLKFSVMGFQPENNYDVMKWCVNCDFGCIIPMDNEYFICPNCQSEFCPQCNKKHFMSKCEDIRSTTSTREIKEMLRGNEEFFTNFMQDYVKCPNCREAICKVAGCNFLTCTWPRCKGICFCAICNKVLTKDQHFSHYKVSGPFGGTCNTTDNIYD